MSFVIVLRSFLCLVDCFLSYLWSIKSSFIHLHWCASLFSSFLSYYWYWSEVFSGKIADSMSFILKNRQYLLQMLHVFIKYTNTAGPKGILLESHLWQMTVLFLLHMHTVWISWRFDPENIVFPSVSSNTSVFCQFSWHQCYCKHSF